MKLSSARVHKFCKVWIRKIRWRKHVFLTDSWDPSFLPWTLVSLTNVQVPGSAFWLVVLSWPMTKGAPATISSALVARLVKAAGSVFCWRTTDVSSTLGCAAIRFPFATMMSCQVSLLVWYGIWFDLCCSFSLGLLFLSLFCFVLLSSLLNCIINIMLFTAYSCLCIIIRSR